MKRVLLERLRTAVSAKRAAVLASDLETGEQWLLEDGDANAPDGIGDALRSEARAALRADRAVAVEVGGRRFFLNVFPPPRRLIVVGAVHIAQALVPAATLVGFEVVVVDPRLAFAASQRFPGVRLSLQWPDEGVAELAPDARTAVVTLTHDPKLDDPALAVALRSDAFYVGALGSRRTHARRLERLRAQGFGPEALARITGPVGLAIGARTPAEIAIAIVADLIARLGERP